MNDVTEKTLALNEIYRMITERVHLPKASFSSIEDFYEVLNRLKDERKMCVEMLAFLHAEEISAQTIMAFLDAHDIVRIGSRMIYDGDEAFGYRKHASFALASLVCEVYKNLSKEKMMELVNMQFSGKTIKLIEEVRL
jgi:hypothetical protein